MFSLEAQSWGMKRLVCRAAQLKLGLPPGLPSYSAAFGNTWLRQLLEQTTGVATGSVYVEGGELSERFGAYFPSKENSKCGGTNFAHAEAFGRSPTKTAYPRWSIPLSQRACGGQKPLALGIFQFSCAHGQQHVLLGDCAQPYR